MIKIFLVLCLIASQASVSLAEKPFTVGTPSQHGYWTNAQVYKGFGCTGQNRSPQLSWQGVPKAAKSLAVTIFDPDAPTGSGWWHWTLFNIPTTTTSINSGGPLPTGSVQGRTDYGTAAFGGACPPQGDKPHRYVITIWALKTDKLPLDNQASGALVGFMLNQNALAKTQTVVRYKR